MKQDAENNMQHVSVNVDLTVVFVIINNVGMMINAGVNAKNWLIKAYAVKDLFGILVVVSVNVKYLGYKNCKCRKMLADKLAKECSE